MDVLLVYPSGDVPDFPLGFPPEPADLSLPFAAPSAQAPPPPVAIIFLILEVPPDEAVPELVTAPKQPPPPPPHTATLIRVTPAGTVHV